MIVTENLVALSLPRQTYTGVDSDSPLVDVATGQVIRPGVAYPYAGGWWECVRFRRPWLWGHHAALIRVQPAGRVAWYYWTPIYYTKQPLVVQHAWLLDSNANLVRASAPVI
jgi:hypothetical protein